MKEEFAPDKSKFKDSMGKYITQSLFLEMGYNADMAVYTFKDADYEYKGTVYPSLRALYLKTMDPTEYIFAEKYLWGWEHWQRILDNKELRKEIDKWREELEVKLRAYGLMNALEHAKGNFTAAQWVANGKWKPYSKQGGRPSKQDQAREKEIRQKAADEAERDAERLGIVIPIKGKKNG